MSNTISISPRTEAEPDTGLKPVTVQVLGACPHDCPDTCSLLTTVEGGVATRVQGNPDHPHTGGVLCNKVSRYTERTYHPERLLSPLRRSGPKGSGQFEPVSWEAALADISARLKPIAARNPEAIVAASYGGTLGVPAIFPRRCFTALGELRGDQGARVLIQRELDTLVRVPLPNAAIDIDRPEDLLELETRRRRPPPVAEDGPGAA
jgi:hypothetical protein